MSASATNQPRSETSGSQLAWRTALAESLSPLTIIRWDEPLAKRTTLRVGGPADALVEPGSLEDLAVLLRFCAAHKLPWFVLGRGSNLLVKDAGVRGVIISLAQPFFSEIKVEGQGLLAGAGARLRVVAFEAKRLGIGGLEFFEGIPGTVGGALRMNAGAMGSWTFDVVRSITVMSPAGEVVSLSTSQLQVEYRVCPLLKTHIGVSAFLNGLDRPRAEIEQRMNQFSQKRWASQPAAPSAGCIFKNPSQIPAGKLIDELGLKGTRVGGARVSLEHGNFIVNDGEATAADVLALSGLIRERAREARGIELELEVEVIGE